MVSGPFHIALVVYQRPDLVSGARGNLSLRRMSPVQMKCTYFTFRAQKIEFEPERVVSFWVRVLASNGPGWPAPVVRGFLSRSTSSGSAERQVVDHL